VAVGGVGYGFGSEDVVFDGFSGVPFHHGDVWRRGGI
jgi:hypothetical protein